VKIPPRFAHERQRTSGLDPLGTFFPSIGTGIGIGMGADRLMCVRTSRRRVIELVAVADHVHDHDHVNEHGPLSLTSTYEHVIERRG
jgi:hypothetical protein